MVCIIGVRATFTETGASNLASIGTLGAKVVLPATRRLRASLISIVERYLFTDGKNKKVT
jgi:hypothetical protein